MDDARFDALAKHLASGFSRRTVLRGLASLTGVGAAALVVRGTVAATNCADRCDRLPPGSPRDQCQNACAVAEQARATAEAAANEARATAEAAGNDARARAEALRACHGDSSRLCGSGTAIACCNPDEVCQDGACVTVPGACVPVGGACSGAGECCAPNVCAEGACAAACPPGYRACDGVCYPGGCCSDADCGNLCLVCGTDHVCHPCEAVGLVCQNGTCVSATTTTTTTVPPTTTTTAPPTTTTTTTTTTARPCGQPGATCASNADCCSGSCVGGVCACGGPGTACTKNTDCCGLNCANGTCGCLTCAQMGAECGSIETHCGPLDCGTCPAGQCLTCTADNTCVSSCASGQVCHAGACCTPKTCADLGKTCGTVADGCGGTLECGSCDAAQCLACGTANTCVSTCTDGQICCAGTCKPPLGGTCQGDGDCCTGQVCCGGTCKLPAGASGCRGNADCCSHTIDGSDVCCGGTCCYTCQGCNSAGPNCAGANSNAC